MLAPDLTFAVGLLGSQREWPPMEPKQPPSLETAEAFIVEAIAEGVVFFDMAPTYASVSGETLRSAERTFGLVLRNHPEIDRTKLIMATKFGENYDPSHDPPYYTDHSATALIASLDKSIKALGTVPDVLFVHKATADLFTQDGKRDELYKGLRYAMSQGIRAVGASVSDLETARLVLRDSRFTYLQFPYSVYDTKFEPILREMEELHQTGRQLVAVINRPLGMGKGAGSQEDIDAAFAFIENRRAEIAPHVPFVVLSGTSNPDHLQQNLAAFTAPSRVRFSS